MTYILFLLVQELSAKILVCPNNATNGVRHTVFILFTVQEGVPMASLCSEAADLLSILQKVEER